MRTPTWESSPGALEDLFLSGATLFKADAWTFTLAGGAVIRWSGAEIPLTFNGNTFDLGPGLTRGYIKWRVGITTDTLSVAVTDIVGTLINGQSLPSFIRRRGFDNAQVLLERVFARADNPTALVGALPWFVGDVDDVEGDRNEAQITVASFTRRLEVAVPRDVYQTQCSNLVFDPRCKADKAAFTVTGTATSDSDSYRTTFTSSALGKPIGWGDLGVITMTSGANAGVSRTCKRHTTPPATLTALQPWPFDVAIGDTFSLVAGCDRMAATCNSKFANLANFRIGTPYVPAAETVL